MKGYGAAAVVCLVLACGCRDARPPVGAAVGRVTYRGTAVAEGSVTFSDDAQGVAYVADLGPDGTFTLASAGGKGLPPGAYAVAIRPPRASKTTPGSVIARTTTAEPDCPNIPPKYRQPKTSGFVATVKAGSNELFVFDMK
ncbi:hypothetical protein [Fimbriiglobus ruber]|uniref:Carboxypeptidase regulatory-like domain-containing protein n=1 Tax=Fimbriiglobus ruber TaxID=1908690 RepID=A0A225DJS0_9BACT|nr:hypothetical protein [Fimbriiglobus ruber]OWK39954.1 hypothetical protein FRUB_05844 [Fimbriiglobus ruber]